MSKIIDEIHAYFFLPREQSRIEYPSLQIAELPTIFIFLII